MTSLFSRTDAAGTYDLRLWSPQGSPRAVMHILHGMSEHEARYAPVAEFLADQGMAVYAHSHPGHGPHAGANLGHFGDRGGWHRVLGRVEEVQVWIRERHPSVPHFLLGHSMGSFVAMSYLSQFPASLAGLVLTGSTCPPKWEIMGGYFAAKFEVFRQGKRGKSALLEQLSFGGFNRRFAPTRTPFDWLSRNPAAVDRYLADPLCGFRCTNQLWVDLVEALRSLFVQGKIALLPHKLPILLLSGDQDPVGGRAGVTRLREILVRTGHRALEVQLIPEGRHELFDELDPETVMAQLAEWLEIRISTGQIVS